MSRGGRGANDDPVRIRRCLALREDDYLNAVTRSLVNLVAVRA
ncbi:hypothetical protein AS9A_2205 [Hoyosella subflava DQS3-9A1]|uniref:Uncharacterized protein n=1 Tax=Hoyosella subflava (strain DSM 45089 / JCM 17490 / NBRC 109087 / DQS3-9A1) TaxID=443218 RepID=F6EQG9_HOYSD|nr:hypothetical protein AS9A_2205 [Hoyosella subflava DQS3-9A1]